MKELSAACNPQYLAERLVAARACCMRASHIMADSADQLRREALLLYIVVLHTAAAAERHVQRSSDIELLIKSCCLISLSSSCVLITGDCNTRSLARQRVQMPSNLTLFKPTRRGKTSVMPG